jgi:hypothetical protein
MMTAEGILDTFGSDAALRENLIIQCVPHVLNYVTWNDYTDPTLNSYSTSTLIRIADMYATRNPKAGSRFAAVLYVISDMINSGKSERLIADMLDLVPSMKDFDVQAIKDTVDALAHYRRMGWVPERTVVYSDPSFAQLMYVIDQIATTMIDKWDEWLTQPAYLPFGMVNRSGEDDFRVVTDERFIKLIWNHVGDYERIITIVKERLSMDYDLLSSVLECESPALSEGAL